MDMAVANLFKSMGSPFPDGYLRLYGSELFVASMSADVLCSAHFDDDLTIACKVDRVGRTSLHLVFTVSHAKDICAKGQIVYVNVSRKTGKPHAISKDLARQLGAIGSR
jgi:acyl-CoA thioesterase FadM